MNDSILVAIITASGGILVAALTFYLTKRHELKVEWRHEKLNHYKTLLSGLSDLATDGTDEANLKFAQAANTIALVAPQYVIDVYNNIFYNPPLSQTLYSHFGVFGPIARPAGFQNSSDPVNADDNLVIRGNLIWNGPADHPLGVEETDQGCQPANATCNADQLRADNAINTLQPQLDENFRPVTGSNIFSATTYAIPDFTWDTFTPGVPGGTLTNTVPYDRAGIARLASGPPGAYAAPVGSYRVYLPLILPG